MCVPTKTFFTYNNNKPWFSPKLRQLRQARSGDRILYNQARNTLTKQIRVAKKGYTEKLKNNFSASNSASVWRSLETITNYRRPSPHTAGNHQLADELNGFYCRFDRPSFSHPSPTPTTTPYNHSHFLPAPHPSPLTPHLHSGFLRRTCVGSFRDRTSGITRTRRSAFNTIISVILHSKHSQLTVPVPTCQWISNFLTDRRQQVRLGSITSSTRTVSTGASQPGAEYTLKTVEMTVNFRRSPPTLLPLSILNNTVSAVETFRFLGSTISQDLKWESNIDTIRKKAQ
ncbi:hypothetical protein L3Q82_002085 [Scortum barcoo]|uniref:Uncharacterized protein n=1 Tax=Scortum barcoo TaxID=214431 RepID=A0ACB8W3F0_9TELE|nr:hypothetical protein L3Q82_002085 [Scortum barcoo]